MKHPGPVTMAECHVAPSVGEAGDAIDAARYRWLRERARTEDRDGGWCSSWRLPSFECHNDSPNKAYHLRRRTFDEAVDAAMAGMSDTDQTEQAK